MTPERLQELISRGETLTVEFKGEEKAPLSDGELVEAVVCLANNRLGNVEEGMRLEQALGERCNEILLDTGLFIIGAVQD